MRDQGQGRGAGSGLGRRSLLRAGGALLLAPAAAAGCSGPLYRYRYRLALEVLVDGVAHRGVNVVEHEVSVTRKTYRWPTETGHSATRGEANVVDLGSRGLLIALLTRRDEITPMRVKWGWTQDAPSDPLSKLYGVAPTGFDDDGRSPGEEAMDAKRGELPIGPEFLPTLVTFGDPSDPKSVKQVDPFDLPATFGPGVVFGRLTLGIVDAPLTHGIAKFLPWLSKRPPTLSGRAFNFDRNLAGKLIPSDFWSK